MGKRKHYRRSGPQPRIAPKPTKQIILPNWLGVRTLIGLSASAPILLVLLFMSLIWGYDQVRHGSKYAFCDDLPVSSEFVPLKRVIFQDGCYIKSVCPQTEYDLSMMLAQYEVYSLKHCMGNRVMRPDRALVRQWYTMIAPKPKPQVHISKPVYKIEMADATEAR